jgi:hypothetical protein
LPYDLSRRSAAASLMGLSIWILLRAWMLVCCVCSGLCDGLIICSEECYRLCVYLIVI